MKRQVLIMQNETNPDTGQPVQVEANLIGFGVYEAPQDDGGAVIFTAGIGVLLLLKGRRKEDARP